MSARWTPDEEKLKYEELRQLYIYENKTIFEIGEILGIAYQTVYDRLIRLGIKSQPENKPFFLNKTKAKIPRCYTIKLAEFVGIMLGDGHISSKNGQIIVTLNSDLDSDFIEYVSNLIIDLFSTKVTKRSKIGRRATDIITTSVEVVEFLKEIGLYSTNKVRDQVDVPNWIKNNPKFWKPFVRGFFDTDGSIYKLKFGVQITFTNHSRPLLDATQSFLIQMGYYPSKVSCYHVYLTRRKDLVRYSQEIGFSNKKHFDRAKVFCIIT